MSFFNVWLASATSAAEVLPVVEAPKVRGKLSLTARREVAATTTRVVDTVHVERRLPSWEKKALQEAERQRKATELGALAGDPTAKPTKAAKVPPEVVKSKLTQAQMRQKKIAKAARDRDNSYHPGERGSILERRGVMIHGLPAEKLALVK